MQAWGKVRERVRNGRVTWWLDLRPYARVWTTPTGAKFESRAHAEGVLSDIRRLVWADGKTREAAVAHFLPRTDPKFRVDFAYGQWIARMRQGVATGEYTKSYIDHLEHYGRAYFGSINAINYACVRFADLEDLSRELAAPPFSLSPKTRHHAIATLRAFFRWMRKRQMIDKLPEIPTVSVPETDGALLEPEQQRAVLDAIPVGQRAIFLALAFHGLRPSEAARLDTPTDYDWRASVARLPAKKAKTRQMALIPFNEELAGLLDATVPAADRIKGGPLFRNPRAIRKEKRWTVDSLEKAWKRACGVVGVECPLYRGTKHSSATAALRRGVPLEQIQAALRHADVSSTRKYARAADLISVAMLSPSRENGVKTPNRPRD
jgi:integrase